MFPVKALALQSYYKCDYSLVTGDNLDEKKRDAKGNISITMLLNIGNIFIQ